MRFSLGRSVAVAAIALLAAVPASVGDDYWVDALHGDNDWSGECNDPPVAPSTCGPTQTVQAAVDLATTPGDVVNILPGEYLQEFHIGPSQSGVTVKGSGKVVMNSPDSSSISGTTNVRVQGITFRGLGSSGGLLFAGSVSNIVVERCRFVGGFRGSIALGQDASLITFRECLFANLPEYALILEGGPHLVERCTFARNEKAIDSPNVLVRNCSFFENVSARSGTTRNSAFQYCNFYGAEQANVPPGPPDSPTLNFEDPLFIDPDSDVYYVRSGSPLLDEGQDGGRIGAFGQGLHTSSDLTKDEPTQAGTPWGNCVDENNVPVTSSTLVGVNASGEVVLTGAAASAAIYSPVFDTGGKFSRDPLAGFCGRGGHHTRSRAP